MRKLTVLTDGTPLNAECRFHLRGRLRTGMFLLECWNLSDADDFRLRNTKELSVLREDSCLAFGRVSDVFCRTVSRNSKIQSSGNGCGERMLFTAVFCF